MVAILVLHSILVWMKIILSDFHILQNWTSSIANKLKRLPVNNLLLQSDLIDSPLRFTGRVANVEVVLRVGDESQVKIPVVKRDQHRAVVDDLLTSHLRTIQTIIIIILILKNLTDLLIIPKL